MYSTSVEIRVRYGETDTMGYLYYGNYALYYEVGRTDFIRKLGITYKELEIQGIIMPVVAYSTKFLRPAYYDDMVNVKTTLRNFPKGKKITFFTELFNENKKLLNAGQVTLAFVDKNSGKSMDCPDILKDKLAPFFNL